jgi:hypothetical protein
MVLELDHVTEHRLEQLREPILHTYTNNEKKRKKE